MFAASLAGFVTDGILLLVLIDTMRTQPADEKNLVLETAFLLGLLCSMSVTGHSLYGAINHLT